MKSSQTYRDGGQLFPEERPRVGKEREWRRMCAGVYCPRGNTMGEGVCLEADDGEVSASLKTWGFVLQTTRLSFLSWKWTYQTLRVQGHTAWSEGKGGSKVEGSDGAGSLGR